MVLNQIGDAFVRRAFFTGALFIRVMTSIAMKKPKILVNLKLIREMANLKVNPELSAEDLEGARETKVICPHSRK